MNVAAFLRHNSTQTRFGDPALGALEILTPSELWAYAIEYKLRRETKGQCIVIEGEVEEGLIGFCLLNAKGAVLREEVAGQGKVRVRLALGPGTPTRLVLRNRAETGASRMVLRSMHLAPDEPEATAPHTDTGPEHLPIGRLRVDTRMFDGFPVHTGTTPAGFWSDWLGGRTRADVWEFPRDIRAIISRDRVEMISFLSSAGRIQRLHEHILAWAPLVLAMRRAGSVATTVALGAGWGRWAVGAAMAAQKLGKDYRIVAVEAEPSHFAWLQRHVEDNGIDPARATLIHAAAGAKSGRCWFQTGDPAAWYGQQIVEELAPPTDDAADIVAEGGAVLRNTRLVSLADVAGDLERIDYLHMDVQGAEADILEAGTGLLDARVSLVNIGTHSKPIEARLRALFAELGWMNLYDVSLGEARKVVFGDRSEEVTFGDGVQVWVNPWI